MKRGTNSILAFALIVIGILLILNAFSGMTGLAIAESVGTTASTILGLLSFVLGMLQYRNIARTLSEEYKVGTGEVLQDYKEGKISAAEAAQTIDVMEPVKGVNYGGGQRGLLYLKRGRPIPMKFATKKQGRELCDALADEALENNPKNTQFIRLPEGKRSKPRRKVHKG
jgi:hypothetical protein